MGSRCQGLRRAPVPWGDDVDLSLVNYADAWSDHPLITYAAWRAEHDRGRLAEALPGPVDAHPANTSPFGIRELAGNVWEWTGTVLAGTGRVPEVGSFDEALGAKAATLAAPGASPVTDRRVARKNVLVYYGVGGIGETTLSEQLEHRFTASAGTDKNRDRAAIRFDFAESAAFDMESYVLRLRAGMGHLAAHWHAFDVAFSVYWEKAHPGEALGGFITRDSALRRTQAKRAVAGHRALKNCDLLAELIKADADCCGRACWWTRSTRACSTPCARLSRTR